MDPRVIIAIVASVAILALATYIIYTSRRSKSQMNTNTNPVSIYATPWYPMQGQNPAVMNDGTREYYGNDDRTNQYKWTD